MLYANVLPRKHSLYGLTGLDSLVLFYTSNVIFSCLVKSNPVKLETSHTVILPQIIGLLCTTTRLVQASFVIGIMHHVMVGFLRENLKRF